MRKNIDPKKFLDAQWSANSYAECAKNLGIGTKAVQFRIATFKKKGIPLKKYSRARYDWDSVKQYAQELAKKHGN